MTYTSKITDVQKVRHQSTNNNFIKVSFNILNKEKEVVETRHIGFSPTTTSDEIKADVEKHVETYMLELKQAIVQRELDKEDENILQVRDELIESETSNENDDDK